MIESPAIATIYTSDKKLNDLVCIEGKSINVGNSTELAPIYLVSPSATYAHQLKTTDVVIYDLDLVAGNLEHVIEDVTHLKLTSQDLPLILIGSREDLIRVMQSTKLKPLVNRVIAKPFTSSQLDMVVNATVSKKTGAASSTPKQTVLKWLGLGASTT